jgi:hypothetical protein
MLHFLEQPTFTLLVPGPEDEGAISQSVQLGRQANRTYLDSLAALPTGGRLTGSFIYAHPPDYIGRPTMEFGLTEWRQVLGELKELGLDTVVYQAAVWVEVRECYYPSKLFSGYKTWNALEPLMEAVAAEGFRLYLGGLGNMIGFDPQATAATLEADAQTQLACFRELMAYQGGFHGFYMSPETGFPGQRQPQREKLLNGYFTAVCRGVKDLMPDLPILMSPGTYYSEGKEAEIAEFLQALFQGCPVDTVAPQDSIGTFGNRLPTLHRSFEIWRNVCRDLGLTLWVNAESFERVKVGTEQDFVPADFERLRAQLAAAAQFGSKIISWEVPYFFSSMAGERGRQLRADYLAYLQTQSPVF